MAQENIDDILGTESSNSPTHSPSGLHLPRYPALTTIIWVYSIFAWIIGIITLSTAVALGSKLSFIFALPTLVIGSLIILVILTISESIKVFIDIEQNTRQAANKT